ncbi:hypothetical protein [Leptospira bandrabouensis]|uniref:SH3 domain-containing protein n=1 Tax=Leptospira bandrabouensis TaxID=2484903 RepID=A0A6H3NQZ1_9LEPT|nr:hypothetical protein [Leptospira bandrabouensis]TGN13339.1 hypothetical protein EHR08_11705 [Leptospira bandrabouensis]
MIKKYIFIFSLLEIISCKSIDLSTVATSNNNYIQVKTSTETTVYSNQDTNSPIVERLKINSYVNILSSSTNHIYDRDLVGKWIQIKTENLKIGWAISHNFDLNRKNSTNVEYEYCSIEINKGCYFNRRSSRLCKEPGLECNQINLNWIYYSEHFLVKKISNDKNWVFGFVNNDIDRKGWVKIDSLAEENQLDLVDSIKNDPYVKPYNGYHLETYVNTFNRTSNAIIENINFNEDLTLRYGIRFYVKGILKKDRNLAYGFAQYHKDGKILTSYAFVQIHSLSKVDEFKDRLVNKFPNISKLINTEYILFNKYSKQCYSNETYRFSLYPDLSLRYRASHETSELDLNSVKKNGNLYILKTTDYSSYSAEEYIFNLRFETSKQITINNDTFIPIDNHKGGKCANYFTDD